MKIGLYFGSFNPIHIGHLIIANSIIQEASVEKVWFVVSPHNPLKKKSSLAHEQDRLDMVRAAVYDNYLLEASDIEFSLPKPSYTIDTLIYLEEKYPENEFCLIMGEDNIDQIKKWKNHEVLLENYEILIYPRPAGSKKQNKAVPGGNIRFLDMPMIDISATMIRNRIRQGKSVQYLIPESVLGFIKSKKLYHS